MGAADQAPLSLRSLSPYVPRLALDWIGNRPDERCRVVDGTMAFVDISGFTKLTERLTRVGRVGSEEISDLLQSTFGALLAESRSQGADLVKWGGDAVLLLFQGEDHAVHAVRAASRMRQALRDLGRIHVSAGQVQLRMSVGVHSGRFELFLVGDPAIHRELIVASPGASITARMESIAKAGQIVVSDETAALLPRSALGATVTGGRVLRSAPAAADVPSPDGRSDAADAELLLPPPLRGHLLEAAGESEHRPVAVAFIGFSGTDRLIAEEGVHAATRVIDDCVRAVQHACQSHGVTFLETDFSDGGGKFMIVAGAPRSEGDDVDRILRVAQSVVSSHQDGPLQVQAGVNYGRVFAGDFGPPFRRTYSVKGDAINLAARVMTRAEPGTVLATTDVMSRARSSFATTPMPPFAVKGKAKPVDAVLVGDLVAEEQTTSVAAVENAFVGREQELASLEEAIEEARNGRGSLVEIIAEPGMGKSRLVREMRRYTDGLVVVAGPSASYESKTPYFAFRQLLRAVLNLHPDDGPALAAARLEQQVIEDCPDLVSWLPLLGAVLGLELPETKETAELEDQFRSARLAEVVVDFLTGSLSLPSVAIFENVHLADDASADILARLVEGVRTRPWVVVVTRSDLDTGYVPVGDGRDHRRMELSAISEADVRSLLDAVTEASPLSVRAMEAIAAKAGGNPLFLKSLVLAAGSHAGDEDLPDSVEGVLARELDRLPADARTLLRYAAVLGVEFSEPMLRDVMATSGSAIEESDLERVRSFVEPDGEGQWRFRHALVRHVAYNGLPYRVRRRMHAHVGRVLEESVSNLDDDSGRLSLHFFHAGDPERAWRYSLLAARNATARYAHGSVIDFYERAVDVARTHTVGDEALAGVLDALGDARDASGLTEEAIAAYRKARRHRRTSPEATADLLWKEASLQQRTGAFVTSFRLITYARTVLRDASSRQAAATRSRLATRYAFGRYLQGDYAGALRWSDRGVTEATASRDDEALAYAYNTMHLVCIHAGVEEELPFGELALAAYRDLGDLGMQAHCLNNLAISALHEGNWVRSAELLDEAQDIFRRVGDTANEANAQYNRADLLIRQRRFADAEPLLHAAERTGWVTGDRELVALATREAGRARAGLGFDEEALEKFDVARVIFTELGLEQELIGVDEASVQCLVALGRPDAALELATTTLERARELQADHAFAALYRALGYSLLAAGRASEARAAFEAGLDSPDGSDGRRDYALNLLGIAELPEQRTGDSQASMRTESREILERLGVLTDSLPV